MAEAQSKTVSGQAPEAVRLGPWRAYRAADGKVYLASALASGAIRVTSPISGVDSLSRIAKTTSGSLYLLGGPPAMDHAICRSLVSHMRRAGMAGAKDISAKLWKAIEDRHDRMDNAPPSMPTIRPSEPA